MIRYHARWVIPVGAPPIRDGVVAVDGERIAWVGPRTSAPPGADELLGDAVLLPGLVNAHIHLDLAMFAEVLRGLPFPRWMRTLVDGLAEATDDAARADAARWSVADQLARGVTTIAHTGQDRVAFDALRALGARGVAYLETFGPDPAQCAASLADLQRRVAAARADETALVRVGVSPHAPYSVSDDLYRATAAFARAEALPVAVHIAESREESRLTASGEGAFAELLRARHIAVAPRAATPVALLERTGVLGARPLCIHAIMLDRADVVRLASSGATVAHCPRANAWLGHDVAPVDALRAAGVVVGVGTDSIASNDAVSVLAEARDAAATLTAAERLELATRGGARALGLSQCGTLVPGHAADLAAFAVRDLARCDAAPERYVIDACSAAPSLLTVVAGAVRARAGRAAIDDALAARMERHRERVRAWAGERRARTSTFAS